MSQVSLLFKDRILSIHQLNQHQDFLIGHAPDCAIHIDSLAVKGHHARISYMAGNHSYKIAPVDDSADIFIENQPVQNETELSDGDHIKLGKHTLIFTFDERNEKHKAVPREPEKPIKQTGTGWIQYLNGSKLGNTQQIKHNMMNITDDSGQHVALISNRHDGFYLSWLQGKPPKVNKQSIGEKSFRLDNNSYIAVGKTNVLFYID